MPVEELSRAPSLAALYGKAAAGLLPGRRPGGEQLPDTELVLRSVAADRPRLAEYARVCGFRVTDALPPTYPHILAFPLALLLMTRPEFPFPVAGVVHLANRISLRRELDAAQPLDLSVRAEGLRPHARGRQLDLVAVASVDGTEVWRGVSTYLHRSGAGGGPRAETAPPAPSAVWRVGAEVGPAYAAVSGDRNPIHLSNLAARAFGFRRRIAHGMWTKARCLAQLSARLPSPPYAVAVEFRAPVLLPATVGFSQAGGEEFAVHDTRTGKPHLSGKVTRE
jgi:hypothetical protein